MYKYIKAFVKYELIYIIFAENNIAMTFFCYKLSPKVKAVIVFLFLQPK